MESSVRQAALAGTWYPSHATDLRWELDAHLRHATPTGLEGRLVALISPHAGLMYSGGVAAHGFALLRQRRNVTVVLLGPSHRHGFDGVAVYDRGAWDTPLGRTPIDEEMAAQLLRAGAPFVSGPDEHRFEHSLEMQLPFLQHLVSSLRIVPMLMGWQSRPTIEAAASALADLCRSPNVILLASSDLSHYNHARAAQALDGHVLEAVARFDPDSLMNLLEKTPEHACGGGPIVAVMKGAKAVGADRSAVLRYGHSGEAGEHDVSRVVGYVSAALWQGP